MRVVFMGTPEFAVPSLEALAATHDVALVVTRPDAVRGRGRTLTPSPVKEAAARLSLSVVEASRVTQEVTEAIARSAPDVIAVAAYGALLPDELLRVPRFDTLNVHASLLPRWRGAAPIQRAVLAGDEHVGVSIMRIVRDLDAGPYCRQASIRSDGLTAAELTWELAKLGAVELTKALCELSSGTIHWTGQDVSLVTYAPKLTKAEMRLTPADDADINVRKVAASTDATPARLVVGGRGVRVLVARIGDDGAVLAGHVHRSGGRVCLGCAGGTALDLLRVRPDGKRDMDASAWAQGLRGDPLTWAEA